MSTTDEILPTWKRDALDALPWDSFDTMQAGLLILGLPDDAINALPGQTSTVMANAALIEARSRRQPLMAALADVRSALAATATA